MKHLIVIGLIGILCNLFSPKIVGHMDPLPEEMLPNPIIMATCPLTISEWRADFGRDSATGFTANNLKIFEETCHQAVEAFPKFIKRENIKIDLSGTVYFSVSLMPFLQDKGGFDYRNLNDADFRFAERVKHYTPDGRLYTILGYTQHFPRNIYLRNDVSDKNGRPNKQFQETLSHEIFHAMSFHYGLFASYDGDKNAKDEKLAKKFSQYLGY